MLVNGRRSKLGLRVLAAAASGLMGAPAVAQVPVLSPDRALAAQDPSSFDVFGTGLALEGDTLLVGARGVDTPAMNAGAIYAYRRIGGAWAQQQKLVFPTAVTDDQIGWSVALAGSTAVTGAPERGAGGSAFILRFDGGAWFSQVEVSDSQAGAAAAFGAAVACGPDTIAVGAPESTEQVGAGAGRVRIFVRAGQVWNTGQALRAPYPDPGDRFGIAVAMDGDLLAIGAPGDDDLEINAGAVYLFKVQGGQFVQVAKVLAPNPTLEDAFGSAVALRNGTLVIGAPRHDALDENAGAAFVYSVSESGQPSFVRAILPLGASAQTNFGHSVASDGTGIAVGGPGRVVNGVVVGGCWFDLDGNGTLDGVVQPGDVTALGLCGSRVAMSSSSVLAASPSAQVGTAAYSGATLLFDRTRDCDGNGQPDGLDLATGTGADLDGDGVLDACQCAGDLFEDGVVNGIDLGVILSQWGPAPTGTVGDINRDGVVNGADLGVIVAGWGPCS